MNPIDRAQERDQEITADALAAHQLRQQQLNRQCIVPATDCCDCRGPIGTSRLAALPSARRCIECAIRQEQAERINRR